MTTIRAEIHELVTAAKTAGKPITANIIWGSLSQDVCEAACINLLSLMVREGQVIRVAGDGTGKGNPGTYEPGPNPIRNARESMSSFMGFREHGRLMDARKGARAFWKEGRKAA